MTGGPHGADTVRQLDHFDMQVPHTSGEGAKVLRALKDAGVNLHAVGVDVAVLDHGVSIFYSRILKDGETVAEWASAERAYWTDGRRNENTECCREALK